MLGSALVGLVSALLGAVIALVMGGPIWIAFLAYCVVGSIGLVLAAVIRGVFEDYAVRRKLETAANGLAENSGLDHSGSVTVHFEPNILQSWRPMRILAVDDDPFIRELIAMISKEAGFPDVVSAASGRAALDLLASESLPFDCLLLDINMPEMDGIELCRRVRRIPAYRDTPIIMLTAMRDMKNMANAFLAGATDFATKPFDIIAFGERLKLARELSGALDHNPTAHQVIAQPTAGEKFEDIVVEDNVQIEGVANLIEKRALENYLTQLPQSKVANVVVLAAKIDLEKPHHPHSTKQQHISVLRDVAAAIAEVLDAGHCLMAYEGDGTFLIVTGTTPEKAFGLEAEINQMIARRTCGFNHTAPGEVTVALSVPIQPGDNKALRVETCFNWAILSARNRVFFNRSEEKVVRRGGSRQ